MIASDGAYRKPSIEAVHNFLRKYNALIVHFSGAPKGGGSCFDYQFPEDLRIAMSGAAASGVCCSVVKPGDRFLGSDANAFGTVGLILDLNTNQSLATATAEDGGSFMLNGVRQFAERDIDESDLEASLDNRTSHNEWGMRNFKVRGLFVAQPIIVWGYTEFNGEPIGDQKSKTINEIQATFTDQPIYTFGSGSVWQLLPPRQVEHRTIYFREEPV